MSGAGPPCRLVYGERKLPDCVVPCCLPATSSSGHRTRHRAVDSLRLVHSSPRFICEYLSPASCTYTSVCLSMLYSVFYGAMLRVKHQGGWCISKSRLLSWRFSQPGAASSSGRMAASANPSTAMTTSTLWPTTSRAPAWPSLSPAGPSWAASVRPRDSPLAQRSAPPPCLPSSTPHARRRHCTAPRAPSPALPTAAPAPAPAAAAAAAAPRRQPRQTPPRRQPLQSQSAPWPPPPPPPSQLPPAPSHPISGARRRGAAAAAGPAPPTPPSSTPRASARATSRPAPPPSVLTPFRTAAPPITCARPSDAASALRDRTMRLRPPIRPTPSRIGAPPLRDRANRGRRRQAYAQALRHCYLALALNAFPVPGCPALRLHPRSSDVAGHAQDQQAGDGPRCCPPLPP